MNKKQMYNRIMEKVSVEVKKALNECGEQIVDGTALEKIIEKAMLDNCIVMPMPKEYLVKLSIVLIDSCAIYEYINDTYILVFKLGLTVRDIKNMFESMAINFK